MADCVLANSGAVRENLVCEGYPPAKLHVIRNGIVESRPSRPQGDLRRELGLTGNGPIIAVISRLNRLKGIEYFLKAAVRVAALRNDARFLVVGDGVDPAYRHELESFAHRLRLQGRILFTGFRLDVPSILRESTVSVLPSLSEGLSNVLLESMAAGIPVVATRVGGNPEVVQEGVTGLLVPPCDDAALAGAIIRILQDPELARRFGAAGRQYVGDHFSLDRMVIETQRLYVQLLNARSRRPGIAATVEA
jgi:glycosyltransferase involved in cell wall biosynthesis